MGPGGEFKLAGPCCPQNLVRWCDSSPCKNGGKCWQTNTLYRCECHSGWTGLYCDVPSVSCEVAAWQQGNWLHPSLAHSSEVRGCPPGGKPRPHTPCCHVPCRHRSDQLMPEWRALHGRRQHTPLPLPGWLHGQLL